MDDVSHYSIKIQEPFATSATEISVLGTCATFGGDELKKVAHINVA